MNDPHDRFAAWLSQGATDEPARDVALHASGCAVCIRMAAGLDSLGAIDLAATPLPPVSAGLASRADRGLMVARMVTGLAAAALVIVAMGVGTGLLRRPDPGAGPASITPSGSITEGVLGGGPGGVSDLPTPTPSASSSAPAPSVGATSAPAFTRSQEATAPPVVAITAAPTPVVPVPGTAPPPPPTAEATPVAAVTSTPTVAPTPVPTAVPTPVPTSSPTAVPTLAPTPVIPPSLEPPSTSPAE